jgi:hypothetical protein
MVAFITAFWGEMRYPGDAPELLPGGETEAITMAARVKSAVVASLGPYLDEF